MKSYTDAELLQALQAHDEGAFGYLYDAYSKALYGIILQIIPQPETAEDTLQEVFVRIWQNIGAYDPHDGLNLIWMHDEKNNPPKTAQVTGDYPIADIRPFDLEISADKNSLYGITELIDKTRTLVKIDLPKAD